jgi:hypothetical protein
MKNQGGKNDGKPFPVSHSQLSKCFSQYVGQFEQIGR